MYSILYVRIWAQRDLKFCSKLCIEYGMGMKSVFQFLNSGPVVLSRHDFAPGYIWPCLKGCC